VRNRDLLVEMRQVLMAQRSLLNDADIAVTSLEHALADTDSQVNDINNLGVLMSQIEESADLLESSDFDGWDENDAAIRALYDRTTTQYSEHLKTVNFTNWNQFVRDTQIHCLTKGMEAVLPWEAMLTPENIEQLKSERYETQYQWDKWDYIFVGAAGVLASLTDFLLVALPRDMPVGGSYSGQKGSPITAWMKTLNTEDGQDWFSTWVRTIKDQCKVPYDRSTAVLGDQIERIPGMGGRTHRFQTLGHDPILGFVFGVLDIMRGTMTGFSYDTLSKMHAPFRGQVWSNIEPIGLIEAIIIQFKHLLTDVATPAGLPAPFMSLLQTINVPVPGSPKGRTVAEIARWMYTQGYDFRHFLVSGITPAVIEIVLRFYLMLKHYSVHGETKFTLASNPKYRSMLLSAHAIACAGNAGKITLMQGNPLAINYAEWLAMLRYLVPSLKYWVFDRRHLRLEHMSRINDQGWEELCSSSQGLLKRVYSDSAPVFALGAAPA